MSVAQCTKKRIPIHNVHYIILRYFPNVIHIPIHSEMLEKLGGMN